MDKVIQTEVLLNFLNTVLGKAVYHKEEQTVLLLTQLRDDFYKSKKEHGTVLEEINDIDNKLTTKYA